RMCGAERGGGTLPQVLGRPTTLAVEGMVATPHYLASVAGLRALQSGGNAVDAAVAANAVLTVVYPHMCALGGDAFFLIWEPGEGRLHALNRSEEHTSELQSRENLVCRLLLEKKK